VKEWQKELYIYRLNPAPPRINDLQEYIELYLKEKDNTYFNWFMHYYEPTLNSTAMDTVQQYAMYGTHSTKECSSMPLLSFRQVLLVSKSHLLFCFSEASVYIVQ
jgi:hypothetical protein